MEVKGNHPIAEAIAKALFGIESVPKEHQQRMINRACKKAIEAQQKELGEQQRINNLVLADKCDELNKFEKDYIKREELQPILDVYEKWKDSNGEYSKFWRDEAVYKYLGFCYYAEGQAEEFVDKLWQAIKQVAERNSNG